MINLPDAEKVCGNVRIAYQTPIMVKFNDRRRVEIIPYTFEDSLAFANMKAFVDADGVKGNGLTSKFRNAFQETTAGKCHEKLITAMYNDKGKKAELATDILMWDKADDELRTPKYIQEGLDWLNDQLKENPDA